MNQQQAKLGRDLKRYKAVVIGLRLSFRKTQIRSFRKDIKAALRFNRARVRWIEWQMEIGA